MLALIATFVRCLFASRSHLQLENLALRHQLAVYQRSVKRPKHRDRDRVLWSLGIDVAESTVAKYMTKRKGPASPTWTAFLRTHLRDMISVDFFVVPTVRNQVLYVFLVLLRDRDGIYGDDFSKHAKVLGLEELRSGAGKPWQDPYVERLIGTIRRECLDHVIIFSERHLTRVLRSYLVYYNGYRTHQSLEMDAPDGREIERSGKIRMIPHLGGLHHHFERAA